MNLANDPWIPVLMADGSPAVADDTAPEAATLAMTGLTLGPHASTIVDQTASDLDVATSRLPDIPTVLPAVETLVGTIVWAHSTMRQILTHQPRTALADYEATQRRRVYTTLAPVVLPWISGGPWDHDAVEMLVQDEVAVIEPHLLRRTPEETPTPGQLIGTIRRDARALTDAVALTGHQEAHR